MSLQINVREMANIAIVNLEGRITLGEAASSLRQTAKDLLLKGVRHIVLNLEKVQYVDSAGLGELVGIYVSVRNQSGDVKLVGVNAKLHGLMQVTKLHTIFEVLPTEAAAVAAFGSAAGAGN